MPAAPADRGSGGSRRAFLLRLAAVPALLRPAAAAADDVLQHPAVRAVVGDAPVARGRVALEAPLLAASGDAVPVRVTVESPMGAADRVRAIRLIAPENPRPLAATFRLGPRCPRAEVSTRMRLGSSQRVVAVAELSDGSLWAGEAQVVITLSGCFDGV